jgi:glutamate-1-semialdehyde 2,1-aminomutase
MTRSDAAERIAMPDSAAIDRALAAQIERYRARTPASRALYDAAQRSLAGGNTRSVLFYAPYPLAIARGRDCRLWDADGHEYIDLLGEFTAGLYGHSHPVIRAAIDAALDDGINLSGHNLLEARLAELVCARIASIERVRFTNSGTEANLMALAAATAFTGRRKVLVFRGGYHGGVLSFANGDSPVNVPHDWLIATYNDPAEAARLFDAHGAEIAAVLVEPMQGAAGCIPGDPAFLRLLHDRARAAGALLVFDEVMTSRLAPGARQAQLGIAPDLTTLGKYIGGGMSFGAFGGRADVMAQFDPRRPDALAHAGTFNNNVLTMAAGAAGLGSVYTADAALALNARGDALRERLDSVCRDRRLDLQFSGLGSLLNLHPGRTPPRHIGDLRHGDPRIRDLFFFHMAEHGYYLARRGFIALSLPLSDAQLDGFVDAFAAFADAHRALLT